MPTDISTPKINFRAVADEHDTTVGAANKRFSRINSTHTATAAFMYSCLKHSGYQKVSEIGQLFTDTKVLADQLEYAC